MHCNSCNYHSSNPNDIRCPICGASENQIILSKYTFNRTKLAAIVLALLLILLNIQYATQIPTLLSLGVFHILSIPPLFALIGLIVFIILVIKASPAATAVGILSSFVLFLMQLHGLYTLYIIIFHLSHADVGAGLIALALALTLITMAMAICLILVIAKNKNKFA